MVHDAVTGEELEGASPHEFLEMLTHDALFIQIPKIRAARGTRLERVLAMFDQSRQVAGDRHRLAVDEELGNADALEDVYQLEQEQLAQELEATRQALRKQEARLEAEQRRREEEQALRETAVKELERLRRIWRDHGLE